MITVLDGQLVHSIISILSKKVQRYERNTIVQTDIETDAWPCASYTKLTVQFLDVLAPGTGVELTLKNTPVLEKYRILASLTFFSAACGLTISNPF